MHIHATKYCKSLERKYDAIFEFYLTFEHWFEQVWNRFMKYLNLKIMFMFCYNVYVLAFSGHGGTARAKTQLEPLMGIPINWMWMEIKFL